jgi:hypothetical protein
MYSGVPIITPAPVMPFALRERAILSSFLKRSMVLLSAEISGFMSFRATLAFISLSRTL